MHNSHSRLGQFRFGSVTLVDRESSSKGWCFTN